jgi:hypothetical protein
MKTNHPNLRRALGAGVASASFVVFATFSHGQTLDPSIFDGSHTVAPNGTITPAQGAGNDPTGGWQDDSLTVYGPDGQNPQPWGVETQMPGMQGMQIPGMEGMSGQQGGGGMGMGGMGLPPLMGGGGGGGEGEQQQIPPGMEGSQGEIPPGMESSEGQIPPGSKSSGEIPEGAEPSKQMAKTPGGETAPSGKSAEPPPDMEIGDSKQQIDQAKQAMSNKSGDAGKPGEGEEGSQESSQDSTEMKSASGKQSGGRGAGSEEGDAMPADL